MPAKYGLMTNIQIGHPCGVASTIVYPEWALSSEGIAQSSFIHITDLNNYHYSYYHSQIYV